MPIPSQKPIRSPFQGFLPFFWLSLALIMGILFADWVKFSSIFWAVGMSMCILALVLGFILPKNLAFTHLFRRWTQIENRLPSAVLAVAFFLGGWRYTTTRLRITPQHVAYFNNRGTVQIVGEVVTPPEVRDKTINLTVQVQSLFPLGKDAQPLSAQEVTGLVLVQVLPGEDWVYGDLLLSIGKLETPFEGSDFSYRGYLERKRILSLMPYAHVERIEPGHGSPIKSALYTLRIQGYETLKMLFPPPESDLLSGILLGRDEGMSSSLNEAFRRTGTTHIIAISGFNIAILAGLFSSIFTRLLGKKWGALVAILAIASYTILVGGDAAVVRAAIMGGVGVFGGMFGRRQNGLNSLGLAALLMMLINPDLPWDVGFQLSAAATLGLILYAQPLEEHCLRVLERWLSEEQAQKWIGLLSEILLFTIAAQIMTLPLIVYHFRGVSWLMMLANPLILPVQSLVMILGGLAMLTGMILPGLGHFLAMLDLPFVRYTIKMVNWLARWPGSDLVFPEFNLLWLVLFYALLIILTLLPKDQRSVCRKIIFSPSSILIVLTGLVVFTWNRVLTTPDGRLHLTLLDSEGTVLIQSPTGQTVLVGGGPSPSSLNQALGDLLPAGDRTLDVVIVGSSIREDINALTGTLNNFDAGEVLWGVEPNANTATAAIYSLLLHKKVPIKTLGSGQFLNLDQGVNLKVIWAGERGAVLWLEWENFSALLPTGKVEGHWLQVPGAPDALLLPDGISVDDVFLWKVNLWSPSVILMPLEDSDLPLQGENELMVLFKNYPLVNTLDSGWVRLSVEGDLLWVNGEQ